MDPPSKDATPSDEKHLDINDASEEGNTLDEENIRDCLQDAEELKQEGNEYFRAKSWNEALTAYRRGLGRLPKRKVTKGKEKAVIERDEDLEASQQEPTDKNKDPEGITDATSPLEIECAKARAVLNANIGACYVKMGEHEQAVRSCADALLDDPQYIKALQRRAQSNERIGSWSSLSSAQEDYNTLLTLLVPSSSQAEQVQRALQTLKPRVEEAQKQEMGEMVDKLKGLGNKVLGNFGLSTDNFKFEPNGQGGYSMNFVR